MEYNFQTPRQHLIDSILSKFVFSTVVNTYLCLNFPFIEILMNLIFTFDCVVVKRATDSFSLRIGRAKLLWLLFMTTLGFYFWSSGFSNLTVKVDEMVNENDIVFACREAFIMEIWDNVLNLHQTVNFCGVQSLNLSESGGNDRNLSRSCRPERGSENIIKTFFFWGEITKWMKKSNSNSVSPSTAS